VQETPDTGGVRWALPRVDLLVVFVVGELPKRGLHHQAFAVAADLAWQIRDPLDDGLFVLGPQFSGTALSLRLALEGFVGRHPPPDPPPQITVIAGAATDPGNHDLIAFGPRAGTGTGAAVGAPAASATFEAMNVPVDQLQDMTLRAIRSRLGDTSPAGDSRQIAMLIETGTQWASNLSRPPNNAGTVDAVDLSSAGAGAGTGAVDDRAKSAAPGLPTFRFPLHISQLRVKREKSRQDGAVDTAIPTLRNTLELRLDRTRESADDLPAGSSLTPYMIEIMLHEQLIEIAREHFRFLGVAATDPTDLVFIVEEARKYCPGVQIFTLDSHALFSHPDLLRDLDGLLVASTYPLASLVSRRNETFANQGAEGVYNAFVGLLQRMHASAPGPAARFRDWKTDFAPESMGPWIWLTMVSNGAVWPFHVQRPDGEKAHLPAALVGRAAAGGGGAGVGLGAVLGPPVLVGNVSIALYALLLLFALGNAVYLLIGYWQRLASPGMAEGSEGLTYVVVIGGCLLFTCFYWATVAGQVELGPPSLAATAAYAAGLIATAAVGLMLIVGFATWLGAPTTLLGGGGKSLGRLDSAWLALSVAATVAIAKVYAWPFLDELSSARLSPTADVRLALARTVQPTSGVSPALPLLYVVAGLYLWGLMGLRRVRERGRLQPTTPFPRAGEGIWAHTLTSLALAIWSGRPGRGSPSASRWRAVHAAELIALGIALGPCLFFCHELLPTFESAPFDGLFKALFLALAFVVIAGAGRLVAWWRQLQILLARVAQHPMIEAYHRAGTSGSPWLQLELDAEIPGPATLATAIGVADLVSIGRPPATPGHSLRERMESEITAIDLCRLDQQRGVEPHNADKLGATAHAALFRLSALLLTALERIWTDHALARAEGDADPTPLAKLDGEDRIIATAEVIVARQVITLIRHALGRLRGLMTFVSAGALLLVCAAESYPFHPMRFVSLFVWSIAIGGTGTILFVVVSAERDAVLSRIARSRPGRIDLNPTLVAKVAMYGVIPAGLLAASAFPQVGDLLFSWLNPILRAFH
jgi:hypothetical protein